MRLINADELKEQFDCAFFDIHDDYKKSIRIIDNAPTVEERPTGMWSTERGSLEIICSNCSKGYHYHPIDNFYYNYCPHCGAKMEG